jgi:hypothetical protein
MPFSLNKNVFPVCSLATKSGASQWVSKPPVQPMDIRTPIAKYPCHMPKKQLAFNHYHGDQLQYGASRWRKPCVFFLLES